MGASTCFCTPLGEADIETPITIQYRSDCVAEFLSLLPVEFAISLSFKCAVRHSDSWKFSYTRRLSQIGDYTHVEA